MTTADRILDEALLLPQDARAEMARRLLISLETDSTEDGAESEFVSEVLRRRDSIRCGTALASDWDETLQRVRQALNSTPQ